MGTTAVAALALSLALLVSACGGGSTTASRCVLRLYFAPGTPRGAVRHEVRQARATPHVSSVAFVSKAKSLAELKKEYPDLVKDLASNPLPDLMDLHLDKASSLRSVAQHLHDARLTAVVKSQPRNC